jgi:ketosteroid isomerase-like protein
MNRAVCGDAVPQLHAAHFDHILVFCFLPWVLTFSGNEAVAPMFERFTESARRVIFFARYEASQYGSPSIETEHLLLGILREDDAVVLRFLRPGSTVADIRAQIERQIPSRERIAISVEVPLTEECKKVLMRARDEADHFGHRRIGTEHLLLGLVASDTSLAARLLGERDANLETIREQLAKRPSLPDMAPLRREEAVARRMEEASAALENFLTALQSCHSEQLAYFLAANSQCVDCAGKLWTGRAEIEKQFEMLITPYAKKNVACRVEGVYAGPFRAVLASVLWENVTVPGQPPRAKHRMTVVLAPEGEEWLIYLVQVTPIITR